MHRILRTGGVFAPYEYWSLIAPSWELVTAWLDVRAAVGRLRRKLGLDEGKQRWTVTLERLASSGRFRFTSETSVHSVEHGNAQRLIDFVLSEGSVATLLERVSEEAIGLDRLRAIAAESGDETAPWYIGYRVWLGIT